MKRNMWIAMAAMIFVMLLWCGAAMASGQQFVTQPTSTFQGSNRLFVINWETNFIPIRVEIHKYNYNISDMDETVASVTENDLIGTAMAWPIPIHKDINGTYYRVLAFYGTQNTERIQSNPFKNDWANVKFTKSPTSTYLQSYQDFRVHFETSFTPVKTVMTEFYYTEVARNESGYNYIFAPLNKVSPGGCCLYVYYGSGENDYIDSGLFELPWEYIKFNKEPTIKINKEGDAFAACWETSFVPESVKVWKHTSSGTTLLKEITEDMDCEMSYDLPFSADASSTYYTLDAYYRRECSVKSKEFRKDPSILKFTSQTTYGTVAPNGHTRIQWSTNFKPVQVLIGTMNGQQFVTRKEITEQLGTSMHYDLSWEEAIPQDLVIRAYYRSGAFRDSNPFTIEKTENYYFTSTPSGGILQPDDFLCLAWTTNFTPVHVDIIPFNEDGKAKAPAKAFTDQLAPSMSYDLPWEKAGEGTGTVIVRAWHNSLSYIDTVCTIRRDPLAFIQQPAGGTANPNTGKYYPSWETNFSPRVCLIEVLEDDQWRRVETLNYRPNKTNAVITIDLTSLQSSFTYRVTAYYRGSHLLSLSSTEFQVENPQPVTLTLTYPGSGTADQVYTLRQGQPASAVLKALPSQPTGAYTINGWYKDAAFTTPFNLSDPILTDTIAYCKTTPRTYTVTFVTNGGSSIAPLTVGYLDLIQVDPPTRTNYIFFGWYKDADLTNVFAPAWSQITGNTTLYAKWTPAGIALNETNFPVQALRERLAEYDTNRSGTLTTDEINGITALNFVGDSTWTTLRGIEYLTELNSLEVTNHAINNPDLSHNPKLIFLNLENGGSLTTLDLSANTALTRVDCSGTPLTSLDTTMLPSLFELDLSNCSSLTSLSIKGDTLNKLYLSGAGLTCLDLSSCSQMSNVYLNANQIDRGTFYQYSLGNAFLQVGKGVTVYTQADCVEISEANFPDAMFRAYIRDKADTDHNGWLNPEERAGVQYIGLSGDSLNPYQPIHDLTGIAFFPSLRILTASGVGLTWVDLSENPSLENVYLNENDLESLDVSMLPQLMLLNVYQNPRMAELKLDAAPHLQQLMCYGTAVTTLDFSGAPRLAKAWMDTNHTLVDNINGSGLQAIVCIWTDPNGDESQDIRLYMDPAMEYAVLPSGIHITAANFPDDTFRRIVSNAFDANQDEWLSEEEIQEIGSFWTEDTDYTTVQGIEYFTEITWLMLSGAPSLTSIDLSANTELTGAEIYSNDLTEINLQGLTQLHTLDCSDNRLNNLDISELSLTELHCDQNSILSSLTLGSQPDLSKLTSWGTNLAMLDLRECPMLIDAVRNGVKTVKANYTEYTLNNTLVRVDAQTELILPGCVPIDAEYFPDDNFRYVVSSSFDENSSGWLSLDEIADVVGFSIEDEDFTSIQGVEYFTELTSLLIDGAPSLTAADFTGNPALIYADVSSNGLQEIYLNGLNVLNDLSIENNNLTWLDVSSSPLTSLLCHNNPLTSLILGDQPGLTKLSAYGTDLAMLDLRGCPALAEIAATGTRTDHANYVEYRVDESHCLRVDADTEILLPGSVSADEMHFPDAVFRAYVRQYFDTDGSGWLNTAEIAAAKEIDPYETNASGFSDLRGIENLTELTYLGISNSPFLTSLDLSRNPKIKILDIWNTGLTALDLRGLTLRDVSVTRSPIQFLDLGIQEWLDSLVCTGCSVTQLDISGCPMLINAVRNGERTEENGKVTWLDSSWHWVTTDLGVRVRTGLDAEIIFEPLNDTEQTSQIVFIGETANEPDEPMKIGAIFTGWYIGTECTEDFRFSFGTPVTENLTLYAGWIVPEPNGILKLPTMLNTIDAEAFDSVAAEAVIIPESVTAISGNPFTNSGVAYIYGFAGSEAQRFARSNEFIFVPIDSDWLGSH